MWGWGCPHGVVGKLCFSAFKLQTMGLLVHSKGQTAPTWLRCHGDHMSGECFLSCRGLWKLGGGLVEKPEGLIPTQAQPLMKSPEGLSTVGGGLTYPTASPESLMVIILHFCAASTVRKHFH